MNNKKLKWWALLAIDILLTASILCSFCYFHHIRILWGEGGKDEIKDKIDRPEHDAVDDDFHIQHEWGNPKVTAPTCTDEGYTLYTCTYESCNEQKKDDRVPALGHQNIVVQNIKEADETNNGYTGDKYCEDCKTVLELGHEIPALEHKNTVLIKVKHATCTQKGYSGDYWCQDCEEVVALGSETPLADHNYVETGKVDPTCKDEGYSSFKCVVCSHEKKGNYVAIIDHEMGTDRKCVYCGFFMLDTSGDFGAAFPERFLYGSEVVDLSDDAEIRAYAAEQGIQLQDRKDGKFIGFYRSHDLYISLIEVNTVLHYVGTGKDYTVQYFVYDIYVRNIENLFTVTSDPRKPAEKLIANGEKYAGGSVIATINGDYLGNKNHCLFAERNGEILRFPDASKGEILESDACVLYYDGSVEMIKPSNYDYASIVEKKPYQIWNFGPSLLDENGSPIPEFDDSSYDGNISDKRHPRSSFGYYEPGHYCFVSVDGRSQDSEGVRLAQLSDLHAELGCTSAYNMDGGDSGQSYWKYEMIRGDEERGDDQRDLYDIICIGEVKKKT